MRERTLILPIGSLFAFTLALASPLYGQNISSLDTTRRPGKQGGRPARLSQDTKGKPSPPQTPSPSPQQLQQNSQALRPMRPLPAPTATSNMLPHRVGAQGLLAFFGSGMGVEYSYQPWDWLLGGFSYVHTKASLGQDKSSDTKEYLDGSLNGLKMQIQYRALDPVYLGLGLSLMQISGSHGWRGEGVAAGEISSDYDAQLYTADFFLGTEWTFFKNFYVGVEWFGLAYPFTGSVVVESSEDADITTKFLTGSTIESRVNDEISAQLKLYYLNMRVGYRF